MALSPNVVVVAPGDLITSAHLNNIRSNLLNFDTLYARLTADTGWIVITLATGFAGTLAIRRVGAIVTLNCSIQRTGVSYAETDTILGTIADTASRPNSTLAVASYVSAPRAVGRLTVLTSGQIHGDPLGMTQTTGIMSAMASWPVALP